jgi:arabinofuranosyltransferase
LVAHSAQFGRRRQYLAIVLLAAPVVGGLLDALYVTRVGGDFMHGRMLLPCFFALSMVFYVRPAVVFEAVLGAGAVVWACFCLTGFRYGSNPLIHADGISNERAYWIAASGNAHPVTAYDWRHNVLSVWGNSYRALADSGPRPGSGSYVVVLSGAQGTVTPTAISKGQLQESVVAVGYNIGILGYEAGPKVYIFDEDSLANPIGSHLRVTVRGRPGHEKGIDAQWMLGRYLNRGTPFPVMTGVAKETFDPQQIADARDALACPPLNRYIHGITARLTPRLAISNIFHSLTYSTFTFDVNATAAKTQLCSK